MRPAARKTGIIVEQVDGEILVYDLGRDEAHCLKDVTALVWRAADGHTPIDSIVKQVREQSKAAIGDEDVWSALESLSAARLLVTPIERPAMAAIHSRRETIRRVWVAGAITGGVADPGRD